MKKVRAGLLGVAAGVVGIGGSRAFSNYLYDIVVAPKKRAEHGEQGGSPKEQSHMRLLEHAPIRHELISAVDGLKLHALSLAQNTPNLWVICIHGYHDCASSMAVYAQHYRDAGWNVLLPDLRGHGSSEGGYIGFGWDDRLDIVAWCSWILRRNPHASILLHGVSMGAAAALMTAGGPLPEQVCGVVSDCSYTSAQHIITYLYQHSPDFHGPASLAVRALRSAVQRRAGYDLFKADALSAVRRSRTPTLFIHGVEDRFVPASMMAELYENAQCPKEFLWVPHAAHAESVFANPDLYWNTIDGWIHRLLPESNTHKKSSPWPT